MGCANDSDIHCRMLEQMFNTNPPGDHRRYGSYVREMMSATTIQVYDDSFELLVRRFFEEIKRIAAMRNGWRTALDLYIDLQLKMLEPAHFEHPSPVQMRLNELISLGVRRVLLEGSVHGAIRFTNLANACRRVRRFMQASNCQRGVTDRVYMFENACQYNVLVETLDMLQRHAYFEVRSNIHLALETTLPAELIHLVFEYTMEAEGIGVDPRMTLDLVNAPIPNAK